MISTQLIKSVKIDNIAKNQENFSLKINHSNFDTIMENKPYLMPIEAPTPPKLPKYFPDLQGANRGKTPGAGWIENVLKPWLQELNSKYLY